MLLRIFMDPACKTRFGEQICHEHFKTWFFDCAYDKQNQVSNSTSPSPKPGFKAAICICVCYPLLAFSYPPAKHVCPAKATSRFRRNRRRPAMFSPHFSGNPSPETSLFAESPGWVRSTNVRNPDTHNPAGDNSCSIQEQDPRS